jgi:hypothetical protein
MTAWTLVIVGLGGVAQAQVPAPSPGQAALGGAAREQKYLFLMFWKQDDTATRTMRQTLEAALAKERGRATLAIVNIADPAEKPLVDRFGLTRSPMPLTVAVAPNGAITGGFPLKLTEKDVAGAFVSPGLASCLKATQARKLVLLCVQPKGQTELPAGVRAFKADAQYGAATEVVALQAEDAAEAGFLRDLKITPASSTVTALIAPPGTMLGAFESGVTKAQLIDRLKSAQNSCCPGGKCGPGGCCPSQPKK